jgi:hypothetical protein
MKKCIRLYAILLVATFICITNTASAAMVCPKLNGNLSRGVKTAQVRELQQFLSTYYGVSADTMISGYFGFNTEKYLMKFQKEKKISATGSLGPLTRAAIAKACTSNVQGNGDTATDPTNSATSGTQGGTYAAGSAEYTFTRSQLAAKAGNDFADGIVPLGDKRYTTGTAKKGYVFFCNVPGNNGEGGAGNDGPWITGNTWNFLSKISITGSVSWPNATFSNVINGANRVLTGNGLPINHTTGTFPIGRNDPAYAYDRNPNSIKSQTMNTSIPANPTYSETPNCMGMEVGVMTTGVPLFNSFDATLRDAPAHELQDSCGGHPQMNGQYHYHNLSSCLGSKKIDTIVGYAYDGFPITGPYVTDSTYLTTDDLDVCHGITSPIMVDGKEVLSYHYVLTHDFPYSVSCFRGKATVRGGGGQGQVRQQQGGMQQGQKQNGGGPQGDPPQEATAACNGKPRGATCSFIAPHGTVTGVCDSPPDKTQLSCRPNDMQRPQ